MSRDISYNNRHFVAITNTDNGEVSEKTTFHYHQENDVIWAEYSGGEINRGFLIGKVGNDASLEFSYQHINTNSEIRVGMCNSVPVELADERLRLVETWKWLNGDMSTGSSIVEEVVFS